MKTKKPVVPKVKPVVVETPKHDNRVLNELVSVDKNKLASKRKEFEDAVVGTPVEVIVVHAFDPHSFHTPITRDMHNTVRDVFAKYIAGELDKEQVYVKLLELGVDASSVPNQSWLIKVIIAYFYGKKFAKLHELIRSY
jgi:hypothetical protein